MSTATALELEGWRTKKQRTQRTQQRTEERTQQRTQQRTKEHAPVHAKPKLEPVDPLPETKHVPPLGQMDMVSTEQHDGAAPGAEVSHGIAHELAHELAHEAHGALEGANRDVAKESEEEPDDEPVIEPITEDEDLHLEIRIVAGVCVRCDCPSNGSSQLCTRCRMRASLFCS